MAISAVSNNATKRSTKFNATQPSLWGIEPPVYHQLIEVHFMGGREETYCCESSYRPSGGIEIYAGYVGFPVPAENCPLCTKEATQ